MKRLLALLVLALAAALPLPASVADEVPRTQFEESGGQQWTSHQGELDFLAAVDQASDRVEVEVAGTSIQGRPLHLVRVGAPSAPSIDEGRASGRAFLIICTQHGNEPSGREMCLQLLRDWAFTDDPAELEFLAAHPTYLVPTANPDGREANTRGNADGTDINRDHLHVLTPEGALVGELLRDLQPVITVDHHEMSGSTRPDLEVLWPTNLNVDTPLHDLAMSMVTDHVFPSVQASGSTIGLYPGSSDERILRNLGGLRHGIGILFEANQVNSRLERVDSQRAGNEALQDFLMGRSDDIVATLAGARERIIAEWDSRPVYWGGSDTQEPGPTQVTDPPPCRYELPQRLADEVAETFAYFEIATEVIDREPSPLDTVPWALLPPSVSPDVEPVDVSVSLEQEMRTVIPLLLDERATHGMVAGRPVGCEGAGGVDAPAHARVPEELRHLFVDVPAHEDHAA